jgi:hypothetical protein
MGQLPDSERASRVEREALQLIQNLLLSGTLVHQPARERSLTIGDRVFLRLAMRQQLLRLILDRRSAGTISSTRLPAERWPLQQSSSSEVWLGHWHAIEDVLPYFIPISSPEAPRSDLEGLLWYAPAGRRPLKILRDARLRLVRQDEAVVHRVS